MPRSAAAVAPKKPAAAPIPTRRRAATARPRVVPVRSRRHDLDAGEHPVGQDHPRDLPAAGKARLTPKHFEAVEQVSEEKLKLLAFMEEPVRIIVHESNDPNDEPFPEVWNDGICQRFQRGLEQVVKRKFVEVLARAKQTRYSQEKLPDNAGYRNIPRTALRYTFTVLEDTEEGKAWLRRVLAEAQ